jgi:hypothetical protein
MRGGFGRHLVEQVAAEPLLDLLGRNRKILACVDPRIHDVGQSILLKRLNQPCQTTDQAVLTRRLGTA